MKRLSGLDAAFLYLETPSSHMHVGGTFVFDPSDMPGDGRPFDRVKQLVESRLHLLPPFRRRLVEVPFGFHHPLWVEDPEFDIDYHMRRAALPSPGSERELAELAGELMGRQLDRSHPLWELYVVEGLHNGMFAMVTKTHHAAIDGVSGAELAVNLLDLTPEAVVLPPPADPWTPERIPNEWELVTHAISSLSRQPASAVMALRRTVEVALNLRQRNRSTDSEPPPGFFNAPKASFNTSITPHRRVAYTDISLDDVKAVKNTFGGTVNDVVVAVCAGALRKYLVERQELPEEDLVALIPLSVRTEDERGTQGNKVSGMLASLETTIADPVKRLRAVSEGMRRAKEQDKAVGASQLTEWAEFAAPAVAGRAARLISRTKVFDHVKPLFNVIISNVPGPNFPIYMAGAKLVALYPMGPIAEGSALNMTVMSYMGRMYFGLLAGREAVPGLDLLSHYINESLAELRKAAERSTGKPSSGHSAARLLTSASGKKPTKPIAPSRSKKETDEAVSKPENSTGAPKG